MKWSMAALLAVGVIAALSAAVLVAALRSPQTSGPSQGETDETTIVVAGTDLPAMSVVRAASVKKMSVPRDEAPEGALTDPVQVIGKVLSAPVVQGQVFTRTCFASDSPGLHLASALPDGMRAVSVLLEGDGSLEGLLYPGSCVDVLATFRLSSSGFQSKDAISTVLLEGVQVLAVEDRTVMSGEGNGDGGAPSVTRRSKRLVTLMVDTAQAEALQLAASHGTVSLALRNPMDESPVTSSQRRLSELASLEMRLAPPAPTEPSGPTGPVRVPARWETTVIRGDTQQTQVFSVVGASSASTVTE
jgi:pilus assembly protein CpaB